MSDPRLDLATRVAQLHAACHLLAAQMRRGEGTARELALSPPAVQWRAELARFDAWLAEQRISATDRNTHTATQGATHG